MISLNILSARRRRCALVAIAVCLGTSIASIGPAQAAPQSASGAPVAVHAVAAKPADGAQGGGVNPVNDADPAKRPLPAPPEPAAAARQELPLKGDRQADVDLNQPAPAAGQVQLRDLTQNAPEVPAGAVSFSSQDAGPASTLVLFDTTGDYAKLGEYYALGMGTLASHSGAVTTLPVKDYVAGLAGRFTNVVYIGSTYDEPLPRAFIDDTLTGNIPVMWSGFNIWQLAKTDADRAAFTQRYGWDSATSYIDSTDRVTKISYNGASLKRNELNTGGIIAPHVIREQDVKVLGRAECSKPDGAATACASVAQSGTSSFPWAVSSSGLTFIGEIPLTYLGEQDRYIAAADILLDVLQPNAQQYRQAAVRLEDITPDSDPEELQAIVNYLHSENVPFQMAVVPIYTDPKGTENNGVSKEITLKDSPDLVAVLQDAVSKGGTIVQHGTTHQFGTLDNPYNAVSADDFEFIRSWCSVTNDTKAPAIDCQDNSFVQIGGALPGTSRQWASERVDQGRQVFGAVGLPTPEIFETPHYSATREAYEGIGEQYPVRYERELLYAGLLTSTQAGPHDYYGQFFPYAVKDPYGTHVLPENLGNFEPNEINQHPPRLAQEIVDAAKLNLVNTHATASFFFHPYYPLSELKKIVAGIKTEGYTFVPASELK